MSYPSAYCIKCKAHTDTLGKHTVMLGNNRRALKGICPVCATETYRFMPKKDEKKSRELSVISSMSMIQKNQNQPESVALPTTTAKRLDRNGRATPAQELFYYGGLLVILGLTLSIGFLILMRMI